jgi:hypothetical protein
MILKHPDSTATHLTPLDLLGTDETALSKAFAYVLAKDRTSLFTFLRYIGVHVKNTENNYRSTAIEIEHFWPEGRTDIEILNPQSYHVIIECKVNAGRVFGQRSQYLKCFRNVPRRVMCFITQTRDTNKHTNAGITTRHLSWLEILDVFEQARLQTDPVVRRFMSYAIRTYKMKTQKEILVQDLSDTTELKRWKDYSVYKRDVTFGTPLYFAPYFTRSTNRSLGEGMKYLSPILGVLTLKPSDIKRYTTDLQSFTDNNHRVQKWIQGVMLGSATQQDEEYTFYFLGEPIELPRPLMKDGTIKKGRGKNWIAGMIPKNRCVTFAEVIRRLNDKKSELRAP